ncbi:hypothetical protein M5K25_022213 [Dendrobium thyrsiflorum]|uniref:Secreted protein n=1 Tax=Dendrobium thyrsiflorum TaxID=117978 RepID=A0ABD0U5Q6_DENTH
MGSSRVLVLQAVVFPLLEVFQSATNAEMRLLDHPLRRKHRDALPPTTQTKACISDCFVALQASNVGSRSFQI